MYKLVDSGYGDYILFCDFVNKIYCDFIVFIYSCFMLVNVC